MNETGKQGYIRTETVPSKAQIEAAIVAIASYRKNHNVSHIADRLIAQIVLTAAAEVGEPESGLDYMLRHSNAAVNVTIERCIKAVWDAGGDNAEFHCDAIRRALKGDAMTKLGIMAVAAANKPAPTQAQIEAAARAMFDLEYKSLGSDWVIPKWDESYRSYWVPLASAALTAAAEVGEKEITSVDVALAVESAGVSIDRRDEPCKICGSMRWSCGH